MRRSSEAVRVSRSSAFSCTSRHQKSLSSTAQRHTYSHGRASSKPARGRVRVDIHHVDAASSQGLHLL
eukprot:2870674-Lingulodinium_polyedra.AAC.1